MRKLFLLIIMISLGLIVIGCDDNTNNQVVTDLLGREVSVVSNPSRIVCIGGGALRLYSYIGDIDKLCAVEDVEKSDSLLAKNLSLRPYQMINKQKFDALPSCGNGGPNGSADAEKIISVNPDLIISLYSKDKDAMDNLEAQTGVSVVVLSYGQTEAFDNNVKASIKLLGKILNREERAKNLIDYMEGIIEELDAKTKNVLDADKPSVYLGCQSNYGIHSIQSTQAMYPIFNVSHIKNVLDEHGYKGYIKELDLEALVSMDPDIIILDAGGLGLLKQDYLNDDLALIFNSLKAFKNNEVYIQMPYNSYYTNLEIAYANAYYDAIVSYPQIFKDIDIEEKTNEIFEMFLGVSCYNEVKEQMYGGYQRLDLAKTFKNYK